MENTLLNIYDYTFIVNVSSFSNTITGIFSNATYIRNSSNLNDYNVDLQLNTDIITNLNTTNTVTVFIGQSNKAFGTLKPTLSEKIGDRLLETVAHKLFGHGQARAAINNDPEYYSHDGEVWNHLSTSVNNNKLRHDIFNQYVASGRYTNSNDVNQSVAFNFDGLTFDFPMRVVGSLVYDTNLTQVQQELLKNGPNVGGTLMNNGTYNIPVLVRFTA